MTPDKRPSTNKTGGKKVLQGVITSTKSAKTIVVTVERKFMHALYKKHVVSHKKFHAHDEKEEGKDGDLVKIISCRPLSAKKRWRLLEITKPAK
ncbi:30S ribosomal protein S17 [Candidatus Mycoplasma haematohominis]|uniref:Small ribosomal subunit protein uS17 n=1 Tax=Candidatus Mycoplasma haematohominis TaxID=1494318 RepID=A0A478FQW3_9MOLU|nr:30S ribosomal protein S17 [Candidatus Mycoplasma haemohominis]GCE63968.1 30S ribosomal protein S17 [Candidatus Mycoplasma haemohominis]